MCGICGTANWGDRADLERMNALQRHRGPNDSGVWQHISPNGSHFGLGSTRLSIIDLSPAGHMPMSNEDGTVWIAYNGELYNASALRPDLEARGHSFRSRTDTEVIVHLYEEDGVECLKHLNGMFAFCICDLRGNSPRFFLARDHFGIKPLYYVHRGRQFAFASEVKALLQLPGMEASIEPEALDQYLTFLWVPGPETMFHGVFKLSPGHYAVFTDGDLKIRQYWDLQMLPRLKLPLAARLGSRVARAVHCLGAGADGLRRSDRCVPPAAALIPPPSSPPWHGRPLILCAPTPLRFLVKIGLASRPSMIHRSPSVLQPGWVASTTRS